MKRIPCFCRRLGAGLLAGALLVPPAHAAAHRPPNIQGAPGHSADRTGERLDEATAHRLLAEAAVHLEGHRWEAARIPLEQARGSLGELEPWGALLLGEALAGAGRAAEALPLLREAARADPGGPLAARAEAPIALALAHAGEWAAARERIEALLASSRGPAAPLRLALARALEAAQETGGAAGHYLRIWREHPDLPEAERAAERLAALQRTPAAADRRARVEKLLDRGLAQRALDELEGLDGSASELALLRARALDGLGRKAEAESTLAPALAAEAPAAIRQRALELAARLAMRRGAVDDALAHLRRLEKEASGRTAREAGFLAAFFLYDAGRFAEAEGAFRAFAARWKDGARVDEARWYTGWSLYKQGRLAEAARAWDDLVRRHPKSSLVDQALYWQGRAHHRSGAKTTAIRFYREAASRDPVGWYALLSRRRLEELGQKPPAPPAPRRLAAAKEGLPKTGKVGARLRRAAALYRAGLQAEADAELQAAVAGSRDAPLLAAAARLAAGAGDHHRAFQLGLFRLGGLGGAADLAYPAAFAEVVEAEATRQGVDPHFVWAIMRQESGFRPTVRSPAAAVGLMQLLPVTAERIAEMIGRPAAEAERLTDPRINVAYGTWYLKALLDRFGGSWALAAAAYNAGPPAVARWMAEPIRKDLPLDEFVESIPFRETRHYVKRVVANLQTYRLIYGGEPLALGDELPPLREGIDF